MGVRAVECVLFSGTMKIAIVHYHLRTGGVTRVVRHALDAPTGSDMAVAVLSGEPPADPMPPGVRVEIVPELAYESAFAGDPRAAAEILQAAATKALGGPPDVWHIHNHALGKNRFLPMATAGLAEQGCRLLLQIHDFAEDGRPARTTPSSSECRCAGDPAGRMARTVRRLAPGALSDARDKAKEPRRIRPVGRATSGRPFRRHAETLESRRARHPRPLDRFRRKNARRERGLRCVTPMAACRKAFSYSQVYDAEPGDCCWCTVTLKFAVHAWIEVECDNKDNWTIEFGPTSTNYGDTFWDNVHEFLDEMWNIVYDPEAYVSRRRGIGDRKGIPIGSCKTSCRNVNKYFGHNIAGINLTYTLLPIPYLSDNCITLAKQLYSGICSEPF